jgi:hypothetical protein
MNADGYLNFWLFFCEEHPKYSLCFASMKSLTNCENPSGNSLQEACSGFPIAACDS